MGSDRCRAPGRSSDLGLMLELRSSGGPPWAAVSIWPNQSAFQRNDLLELGRLSWWRGLRFAARAAGKQALRQGAKAAAERGAGAILPTSKKADGTKEGYDVSLIRGIADRVSVPVIASGGAGKLEHFYEAADEGHASVLLAASVFHFGEIKIPDLKAYLKDKGVAVRL